MPPSVQAPVREVPARLPPSQPTSRFAPRHARILARWTVLFLALNVADGAQTWLGLRLGIPERFPLYAWLFAHTSFALAMLYKSFVVVWVVAFLVQTRRRWPWPGFAALCMRLLCLETLLVVVSNGVGLYLRLR